MPIQPHAMEVIAPTTKETVVSQSVKNIRIKEKRMMYTAMYKYSAKRKDTAPSAIVLAIVFICSTTASLLEPCRANNWGWPSIFTLLTALASLTDQRRPSRAGTMIRVCVAMSSNIAAKCLSIAEIDT